MIQLTNEYDNPVFINPNHISLLEICTIESDERKSIGVLIHLLSGKTQVVKECLNDIKKKLKND